MLKEKLKLLVKRRKNKRRESGFEGSISSLQTQGTETPLRIRGKACNDQCTITQLVVSNGFKLDPAPGPELPAAPIRLQAGLQLAPKPSDGGNSTLIRKLLTAQQPKAAASLQVSQLQRRVGTAANTAQAAPPAREHGRGLSSCTAGSILSSLPAASTTALSCLSLNLLFNLQTMADILFKLAASILLSLLPLAVASVLWDVRVSCRPHQCSAVASVLLAGHSLRQLCLQYADPAGSSASQHSLYHKLLAPAIFLVLTPVFGLGLARLPAAGQEAEAQLQAAAASTAELPLATPSPATLPPRRPQPSGWRFLRMPTCSCALCFDTCLLRNALDACGRSHAICRGCYADSVRHDLDASREPQCPCCRAEGRQARLTEAQVRSLAVPDAIFERFLQQERRLYAQSQPAVIACGHAKCGAMLWMERPSQASCAGARCPACKRHPDVGMDQERLAAIARAEEGKNRKATVALIAAISKPCPKCRVPIIHYKGHACHHIRPGTGCPNCGHHFCYACLGRPDCKKCPKFCDATCGCPVCPDCKPGRPCRDCDGDSRCPACQPVARKA